MKHEIAVIYFLCSYVSMSDMVYVCPLSIVLMSYIVPIYLCPNVRLLCLTHDLILYVPMSDIAYVPLSLCPISILISTGC